MNRADLASRIIDVVPRTMRGIKDDMRRARRSDLKVVEFRLLGHIARHAGSSLSAAAERLGIERPHASKALRALVEKKLVRAARDPDDGRGLRLEITTTGEREWIAARLAARARLEVALRDLSQDDITALARGLDLLARVSELAPAEAIA